MTAPIVSQADAEIEKLMGLHPKGYDLSLDRIRRLLEVLGNPHLKLPPVIHVAGTNGKGSASAFCRALLEAQGLSVHVHTSPHLVRWHERYRIGVKGGPGQIVDDELFADALRRVAEANGGKPITVFEILTAVTFILFSEQPADVVVLEVGLGGRFDATNVVEKPAVCIIQPISLDHQAYLGDRVELIAAEKAGIMKRGVPVVIGHQEFDGAKDVLISTAERLGCPLTVFAQDFLAYEEFGRLVYQDEFGLMDLPLPRLPGRHQIGNAATAIRAVKAAGYSVTEEIAEKAMLSVEWPGRLQKLTEGRLVERAPAGAEIWLDGGHNPGAGEVIAEAMASMEERQARPLHLVIGMINTKDPIGFFRAFVDIAHNVYTVPITGSDVGLDPVALAQSAAEAGLKALPMESLGQALDAIRERSEDGVPPRIMIGGSLYLAGNVLAENGTIPK
ncbi:MAG: bifunctional folylpolyglutamate synthase/dihydrofolate synthase [Alphaproteobacteria bacterium]|jgi:dihydrofolate synthase/folylpolyglutamate synthase|uniref:bifunctional folylpolyglutamate synthase/dihydrofolate synthase n=1 Tax=Rhizobium/Agrobacterium group TaxID=227290 RepID=UPI0006BA0151|nr:MULTISPECIES: folylpolyglutamate synthase/dihydrofolate synthase family protein [Rhizobium/Agrobacterium group]MBU0738601.1 bifunctional folylpolyglutamate synthase/dihydrofolate synthase [Alphaproteobacteria bacterium]MDM7982172.1 folylpolyglutamate synthase/dihydrofolate synthase family protein [Rhizobium sp.]AOG10983.1 bifunctional FolC family protein [Agrobacterium sp. RAC06]KPF57669.1 bifunctional folylpolyglutamate synthase/dihydrofolate synthase [Rhizobium sp. AAP116]MBU0834154.1 bif